MTMNAALSPAAWKLLAVTAVLAPAAAPAAPALLGQSDADEASALHAGAQAPLVLYLHYSDTAQGTRFYLSRETTEGSDVYKGRAPVPVPPSGLTTEIVIDAGSEGNVFASGVQEVKLVLRIGSIAERFMDFRASLFLNYNEAGSAQDSVFLYPTGPAVPIRWGKAELGFRLQAPVEEVQNARVLLWCEMTPGADWYLRTDGASLLDLA